MQRIRMFMKTQTWAERFSASLCDICRRKKPIILFAHSELRGKFLKSLDVASGKAG
jgi:hypothetical protein